ncbi:hemin uptake protein HemP [Falsiroseomonas sp. E2-1-a20]|uniref:hemin uptake protein HemP n=1 Tax=Falsiroseomonas sp. E2-1-a20 TaxID=3239300 RepID=UPI003F2D7CFF
MSQTLTDRPADLPDPPPRSVPSGELLRGARELLILHQGETYRLRLTSNDKLILTK